MPGENSNPYQYTKTVDQIIVERNNAKAKARADRAAAQEKARKSNQLSNLYTQINEYRRLITLKERDISVTEAAIKAAQQAGDTNAVDVGIGVLNAQRADLAKLKTSETQKNNERKSIVAGLVEANKKTVNVAIKDSGFSKGDAKKKGGKVKPAEGDETPKPPAQQVFTGYKYNAPMVRSEYFTDRSPQTKTTVRGVSGAGNFTDARDMFAGTGVAKGTMQMPFDLTKSAAWKNKTGIYKEDPTMYGFKFLYNPTEVSMGWGMLETVDPNVIRSNAAGGIAPVTGIGLSTIDFTLLLNRISDMNFLDESGLAPGENNPYPGFDDKSRVEDLKTIYKKGTMYDLEYLFKVLNGPSATHQTILNGQSADWGFLIGTQVELFLGDGLRYLVRVNGINVNHTIFNDRMVPVLSQVSISCGRYNDVGLPASDARSQG
jgi:hypothetical protein